MPRFTCSFGRLIYVASVIGWLGRKHSIFLERQIRPNAYLRLRREVSYAILRSNPQDLLGRKEPRWLFENLRCAASSFIERERSPPNNMTITYKLSDPTKKKRHRPRLRVLVTSHSANKRLYAGRPSCWQFTLTRHLLFYFHTAFYIVAEVL